MMPESQAPEEISPADLADALARAGAGIALLDCREPEEHAICALPGAKLLPLGNWAARFPSGFPAPDEPVVVYCHHGFRSLRAVRFLRQHGFRDARSLHGGIEAWALTRDPSMARY